MEIYIAIFIFELSFGLTIAKKRTKYKNVFLIVSYILLSVVAALRTKEVGVDTLQYYRAYLRIGDLTWYNVLNERYEIGFLILCKILNRITENPQSLIILTSMFINFSVIRFINKNSNNVVYSVLCYMLLNFYFSYMNIMRQAIAIAILLFAFECLKNDKKIRYFILVGLATTFHGSAILGILYFVLYKYEYKMKYNKIVIPLLIITFIFGRQILMFLGSLSERLYGYIGSEFDKANYFGALINFILSFIIWWFGNNIIKNKKDLNELPKNIMLYNKLIIVNLVFTLLTVRVSIFNRFTPYFSIFQIIWLSNILETMKKNKQFFKILIIVVLIFYWLIIMIYRPEWYGVVPYKMIDL